MTRARPRSDLGTHEVLNQPVPRSAADLWQTDAPLRGAVEWAGGRTDMLARAGARYGSEELQQAALEARRDTPRLKLFDRSGRRLDEVAFHPGYHACMAAGMELGYAHAAWDGRPGGHVTHAALVYMQMQVEPGVGCPLTMTYAEVPALGVNPDLERLWRPKLTSATYDPLGAPGGGKRLARPWAWP
ncbi:hypothetical protein ACFOHS_09700 [Jhaorihella thermophila]